MTSITTDKVKVVDILGRQIGVTDVYIATTDGNERILFPRQQIIASIEDIDKSMTPIWLEDLNCDEATFHSKMAEMKNFIANVSEKDLIRISDMLPRTKAGTIRKSTFPLYMTGITDVSRGEGWCRVTTFEVNIKPQTESSYDPNDPKSIFARDKKVEGTFVIEFDYGREYNKNDIPIVGSDGTFNPQTYKINSYIKIEDLVPGKVYIDAKDREFLYLGVVKYNDHIVREGADGTPDVSDYEGRGYNVFLPLNAKKKKELKASPRFIDYMQKFFDKHFKKNYYYDREGLKIASSFKVVDEVETLFTPENMFGVVKSGVKKGDAMSVVPNPTYYTSIENDFTFEVVNTKVRKVYILYVGKQYRSNKERFRAYSKKEIKDFMKANKVAKDNFIEEEIEYYGQFV